MDAFHEADDNGCGSQEGAYYAPESRRAVTTGCHREQLADLSCVLHALVEHGCNFRAHGVNCDAEFRAVEDCEEDFCTPSPTHAGCVCSTQSGTIFDESCW